MFIKMYFYSICSFFSLSRFLSQFSTCSVLLILKNRKHVGELLFAFQRQHERTVCRHCLCTSPHRQWTGQIGRTLLCTVSQKRHPFYFCDIFVRFCSILLIFGRNMPQEIKKTRVHAQFTSRYVRTVLCRNQRRIRTHTATSANSHSLVIEPESCNFLKSLLKLLTLQPLSENLRINFLPPEILNLYFFIKIRTSASLGCCVIWSGLHQRVIGEAIDHMAWTAARLCEN